MTPRREKRAYILILPSLFTTGNLFCGFYSVLRSFSHDFERAAYAIILASLFDVLDGRVARMTRTNSAFGVQYDSMADVVSFGIAPAVLAYVWALSDFGRLGWTGAFFFTACGALRLARFTANVEELPKSYFLGLPIPAAANAVAVFYIAFRENPFPLHEWFLLALTFGVGILMVSNIRYRSVKDFDLRHRRHFFQVVLVVGALAFISIRPEVAIPILVALYVLFAPIREGLALLKRSLGSRKESSSLNHKHDEPS